MSGKPLVSVIMSVYNIENYIREITRRRENILNLASNILSQIYQNIECIAIGDDSWQCKGRIYICIDI